MITPQNNQLAKNIQDFIRGLSRKATIIVAGVVGGAILLAVVVAISINGSSSSSYNGPASNGPAQAPARVAHISIFNSTNERTFTNTYSDGHRTTCMVHTFDDGVQDGTGDCAPDGVANGMTNP